MHQTYSPSKSITDKDKREEQDTQVSSVRINPIQMITPRELADLLRVKVKTVYEWSNLGVLPSIKMRGALRFDLVAILKWIETCRKPVVSGYNPFAQNVAKDPGKGGRN
jgi:excisionase family DNA binding protein